VATLNVKNFPDALYRRLKARARRQHRSVAQELTHVLEELLQPRQSSILDLQGLGKELWTDIDPAAHVDAERRGWD
jgi:plasmid stability protein